MQKMNIQWMRLALVLMVAISFLGCYAPGEGEKAEQGKARGDLIVEALAAYQADHGRYPEQLGELTPKYISGVPVGPQGDTHVVSFIYSRPTAGEFRLMFRYTGPGSNTCIHKSTDAPAKWTCVGGY